MNALGLLPEYILLATSGLILLWGLMREDDERGAWTLGGVGLAAALVVAMGSSGTKGDAFFGAFVIDGFTQMFRLLGPIVGIFVLVAARGDPRIAEKRRPEFYALIIGAVASIQLLSGAAELITIFVALELLSITSFILVGFMKDDPRSAEAALKFFLFGVASVGLLLYGFSILFGYVGSTLLVHIGMVLSHHGGGPVLWVVLILLLAGFGFKVLMVPFHMWGPDVYEGAPTTITTFLSVGSKAAGFAVLLRVLLTAFVGDMGEWAVWVALLSAITMTVGNVLALTQKNIKRMLAYSSIAHGGYMLMGLAAIASLPFGVPGLLYYLLGYVFVTAGAFLVVIAVSRAVDSDAIADYAGLSLRAPFLAAALTIFFLSLIGIPPLVGFFGKYLLFGAVIQNGLFWLAIVAIINSVISVGYYVYVVRTMYLIPSKDMSPIRAGRPIHWAISAALVATFLLGLYPDPFVFLVREASAALFIPF